MSKMIQLAQRFAYHFGGGSTSTTSAEIPDELKPLVTGSTQRMLGLQDYFWGNPSKGNVSGQYTYGEPEMSAPPAGGSGWGYTGNIPTPNMDIFTATDKPLPASGAASGGGAAASGGAAAKTKSSGSSSSTRKGSSSSSGSSGSSGGSSSSQSPPQAGMLWYEAPYSGQPGGWYSPDQAPQGWLAHESPGGKRV